MSIMEECQAGICWAWSIVGATWRPFIDGLMDVVHFEKQDIGWMSSLWAHSYDFQGENNSWWHSWAIQVCLPLLWIGWCIGFHDGVAFIRGFILQWYCSIWFTEELRSRLVLILMHYGMHTFEHIYGVCLWGVTWWRWSTWHFGAWWRCNDGIHWWYTLFGHGLSLLDLNLVCTLDAYCRWG